MIGPLRRLGRLIRRLTRTLLRAVERLLWVTAVAGLGLFVVARGDALLFQVTEAWRTGSHLEGLGDPDPPVEASTALDVPRPPLEPGATERSPELFPEQEDPGEQAPPRPPRQGTVLGTLEIPRLGIESPVIEGTDRTALRRGVGRIVGSDLPGAGGTTGLAGHRDGIFRPLEKVRRDDLVVLDLPEGRHRYRVVGTAVVQPSDTWVLDPPRPGGPERLTLVTCYPFRFVGPAPQRFIVYAHRETPLP